MNEDLEMEELTLKYHKEAKDLLNLRPKGKRLYTSRQKQKTVLEVYENIEKIVDSVLYPITRHT